MSGIDAAQQFALIKAERKCLIGLALSGLRRLFDGPI
jgi:hypothetical protein